MSGSLLETKLYIPRSRSERVARPRLVKLLNNGITRKLTLISAPAGFGKTTLVTEWLRTTTQPSAWLSLEVDDNDPIRFLTYLIAALRTITETIGEEVLAALQSPQPPSPESMLTALLNELTTLQDNFILVLDDLHLVDADAVQQILVFLIDHLPPLMHLVITTRQDPNLPLARLRVQGQMTELRAADLRFTSEEAAEFLNQVMGLKLSSEDIAALTTHTEGWIAGLQLAALSTQGREDASGFIQSFTGSHRFVLDYLVEEVLEHQPEAVGHFLLQTGILNRFCSDLCDAVTGQENGRAMLETLERGNLFVVPLDDDRQWYRYHQLFADALQTRFTRENPGQIENLHRQASIWYEQNNLPFDAIHHAYAAQDFKRAARLVQWAWPLIRQSCHETTLLNWVRALPAETVRARPVLNLYYAVALLSTDPATADSHLQDAEQWLDTMPVRQEQSEALAVPPAQSSVVNEDELRSLPGMIAIARAYQTGALQNVSDTINYAQQALDRLPEENYLYRGSAAILLGLAYWASGDLEGSYKLLAEALSIMQMTGNSSATTSTLYLLADLRMAQGYLREANRLLQQALKLAADHGKPVPQGTADVHVVLSELHLERNDLETAMEHLLTSKALGEAAALQEARHRWHVAMACVKEAQGDLDSALNHLEMAEKLQGGNPAPDVRPIQAIKARVWVKQSRHAEALSLINEREVSADDQVHYLREFEHVTLARAFIAKYRDEQDNDALHNTASLLDRLLKAAEAGQRTGSLIEILILQALIHHAKGDNATALIPLKRALNLAEREGFVRLFVDEGAPTAELLREAIAHNIVPDYARQLLNAFPSAKSEHIDQLKAQAPTIEPLSEREIEVLRYIAQGFTNQEIADRLYLSLYTVKAHARNIYSKLDVSNRTEAVARARVLGILRHP